jgi:rubrerythrin
MQARVHVKNAWLCRACGKAAKTELWDDYEKEKNIYICPTCGALVNVSVVNDLKTKEKTTDDDSHSDSPGRKQTPSTKKR